MALIECKNVSMSYDGQSVLKNISFKVEKGDYLCIIGENGSGKSTMVKGLLKLKAPSAGEIVFDGIDSKEIGYLPQQTDIQKDFPASVYEVVLSGRLNSLGRKLFYTREDKKIADEKIEIMGISEIKNKCYHDLSGGQMQRVLLARALCAAKKVILLDEPVAGLDPVVTEDMYNIIGQLNRKHNITVIMVSHDIDASLRYATHILKLEHTNMFYGTVREYKDSFGGKL